MAAAPVDDLVTAQVLRALEPAALELSLQAGEDVAQERDRLDRYRRQECERARHEADRAELCYRAVDPTNRLVARTLERRWEESLVRVRQAEEEYHRFEAQSPSRPTDRDRERIRALAGDIPALWSAPGVTAADRKHVIRCLVERVTVAVKPDREEVGVTIDWCGGPVTRHTTARPVGQYEQMGDYARLIAVVRERHAAGDTPTQIAEARKIGIVMGTEVSRLSRNCADWHRLLELCALFDTLIADADGIYHPRDFNDRILLGLKGTLSEAELHSLRQRLDAGRLSKARRGALVQHLPTGYVRDTEGAVALDPDASVRDRIGLVFDRFLALGSVQKVLRDLVSGGLKVPRRQTSGLHAGSIIWKPPNTSTLHAMLKNPTYAGPFAYGRRIVDPTRQTPGRPATGRIRQPQGNWLAEVKGVYPAYITWEQHESIRETIAENAQAMQDRMTRKQAIRGGRSLLTGLVRCGRCGHAMHVAYMDDRFQYVCQAARIRLGQPSCQFVSGEAIDAAVVSEFLTALTPAHIDALERVTTRQADRHDELLRHLKQDAERLEYAAKRAERQYDRVDPENRLIAATLEKKWEVALAEWEQAKTRWEAARTRAPHATAIPAELRSSFADVGRHLPVVAATEPGIAEGVAPDAGAWGQPDPWR